ncbi:MAG: hypothetical protein PUF51_04920 [Bifidobacteriaceae bacterium]|nr:hypothetical protein [Bifidobacteriaceae bacterium]
MNETHNPRKTWDVAGSGTVAGNATGVTEAHAAGSATGDGTQGVSTNPRRNWTADPTPQANAVATPQPIRQEQWQGQRHSQQLGQQGGKAAVAGSQAPLTRVPAVQVSSQRGDERGEIEVSDGGPSRQMQEYDAATREYKRINGEYQSRVKKAESALARAKKEHAEAIDAARKLIDKENADYAQPVARFAHATLYVDRIEYNHAKLRLDSGQADVRVIDPAEAVRSSLDYPRTESGSRSAKLANKVMGDDGATDQLFVEVRSGADVMLIQFAAKNEQEARSFGSRIVTGAQNYESARDNHEERLANFESNVERVTADVATIEQAQARLDDAKSDTHDLESARTRVDFTRAAVPTLELEQRRRSVRKRNTIAILVLVLVAMAVIAAAWWFSSH